MTHALLILAAAEPANSATSYGPVFVGLMVFAALALVGLIAAVTSLFITRREAEKGISQVESRLALLESRNVASGESVAEIRSELAKHVDNIFTKIGGVERGSQQKVDDMRREISGELRKLTDSIGSVEKNVAAVETEVRLIGKQIDRLIARQEEAKP